MNFNAIKRLLRNYKASKSMVADITVLLALTLGLSLTASADIFQELTFTRAITNCNFDTHPCGAYAGAGGSPAGGNADFTDIPSTPWSFSFVTGPATSWNYIGNQYGADFDCTANPCGTFTMNGPYGLTFSGQITRGSSSSDIRGDSVGVDFEGFWTNGIYGYGHADATSGFDYSADLQTFAQAPEPSSLLMLGTGALGLAGLLRRRLLG